MPTDQSAPALTITERSTLGASASGAYERELINSDTDEALVCHVGLAAAHGPVVLPMTYVRIADNLTFTVPPETTCCASSPATPTCA